MDLHCTRATGARSPAELSLERSIGMISKQATPRQRMGWGGSTYLLLNLVIFDH